MATPKYNKFNTGKTKGYFPLKRWRFNTENHPVIQSKEKCASSTAKTLFSTQEIQMLVGLTNSLQCNEREAIRIALYEASRSASNAYKLAFRYAGAKATDKAHQGRSSVKQWKLPKSEKEKAVLSAEQLGISDSEFLRLAIVWLQHGIRNGSIEEITNSKLIPFDTVAKKWSRENPGSKAQGRTPHPGVAKLKEAAKAAYKEAGNIYRERNKEKWARRQAYLIENGFVTPPDDDGLVNDFTTLDTLVEIQEADNFQRVVQEELDKLRLNEKEAFVHKWLMRIPDLSEKQLDTLWDEELTEAKELAQGEECMEELMKEVEIFLQELRDMMTPEEKEQKAAETAESQRKMSEYIHQRYGWAKAAMNKRDRVLSDPELVFKKWLRRRLDMLFDGRGVEPLR